jgi:DNA-binding NtrC family response regulator
MSDVEEKIKMNENAGAMQPEAWPSRLAIQIPGDLEPTMDLSLRRFRNEAEIHAINYALQQTHWNRKRAARLLRISYRCLLYKIRGHKITPTL